MTTAQILAPYKGLRMFEDTEGDVPFFFGRDRERELLEANLMASRLTVVYGSTGVGKSSLLRAGVAHHLRELAKANLAERGEPELAVVVFDAWRDDPVAALRREVATEVTRTLGGSSTPPDAGASLLDALRTWQQLLGGDVYVLLDQVEEYFLYHGGNGPGSFGVEFPRVVAEPGLRVNFLLAVREDAIAQLDGFKARLPNVLGNYLRLEHLDRESARAAIVEPVRRYNQLIGGDGAAAVEPALVDAVLDQVTAGNVRARQNGHGPTVGAAARNGSPGGRIEAAYLQLVMQRLWEAEQEAGSTLLRLETLERLGGAARIVADHVAHALDGLDPDERDLAAVVFDHLVTPSGTKIAHELSDLARYASAAPTAVGAMLDRLGGDRIVRSVADEGADGARYEIFHDLLAEPVLAWKARHEAERELARQRAEADRRHSRLLRLTALATALLAVMAGVASFSLVQRGEARSQARLARARELAAEAVSQLQFDPQRSLSLAIASARLRPTTQAEAVLRQALLDAHERAVLPSGGAVTRVSFSRDARLVLTASDDGAARIWRPDGTLLQTLKHRAPVTSASFSPDDRLVLTTSRDGSAKVWLASTGRLVTSATYGAAVTDGSFAADGALAVTTSQDGTVRIWRPRGGATPVLVREPGPARRVSVSPDGRLAVVLVGDRAGSSLRARVHALPSGRLLRELPARGVTTASFSPDGRLVITGGIDHTAAVYVARSGRRLHLLADNQGAITDARFGPGGRLAVTTSSDGATRIWKVRGGARVALLLGHANAVQSSAFSPDGRYLVTASADGTARVWETSSGRLQAVLRGHTDAVLAAAFGVDGRVATASADGTARIWDPATAPELQPVARVRGAVSAAAFGPGGTTILEAGDDRSARLLTPNGRVVRALRHPAPVTGAVFTPGGARVVTADATGTVRSWRPDTGALAGTREGLSSGPLAISHDGRLLAAPARDGSMQIVDAATLVPVRELGRGGRLVAASFSPDGRLLATAGADGVGRLWSVATGRPVRTFEGHHDALTDVEFSHDGRLVVTASRDHDARVWQVSTGASTVLHGHFGPVFGASFSPDDRFVVTAGPITAGLWETATGHLVTYLRGPDAPLTSASFSPDGRWILTADRDGTLRLYRCELCGGLDELVATAEARLAGIATTPLSAERQRVVPSVARVSRS